MGIRSTVIALGIFILGAPFAGGHHAFPERFNTSQVREVAGEIVALDWRNPHVTFTVRASGGLLWDVESNSIRGLERYGLSAEAIAVGTRLRVAGFPARNGDRALYTSNLLLPGGREFVVRPGSEPRWTRSEGD